MPICRLCPDGLCVAPGATLGTSSAAESLQMAAGSQPAGSLGPGASFGSREKYFSLDSFDIWPMFFPSDWLPPLLMTFAYFCIDYEDPVERKRARERERERVVCANTHASHAFFISKLVLSCSLQPEGNIATATSRFYQSTGASAGHGLVGDLSCTSEKLVHSWYILISHGIIMRKGMGR